METSHGTIVWLTGLSGAGKSSIANAVWQQLRLRGIEAEVLDGDELRAKINRDLGFSKQDRDENVRRIGSIAALLSGHGITVLVAAISPYRAARDMVRSMADSFIEVHVDAPLALCERRDPKGLYRRASRGEIAHLTGVDDPYEAPLNPEVHCRTDLESLEESVEKVLRIILVRAQQTG